MLSFITDLFPAVYAEEKYEDVDAAEPEDAAAEDEEPEDIKPAVDEGKVFFFFFFFLG